MTELQTICEQISNRSEGKRICVIGIDGLGGAGKSTISDILCQTLNKSHHTILFHIDDFITPRNVRYDDNYPAWKCYYDLQWRYDYLKNDILRKMFFPDCEAIEVELYDKENDSYYIERYTVKENTIVIIEGVFLQRKELLGIYDYMIYMDIPEEIRLERVIGRDTYIGDQDQITEKYMRRYFPAEKYYIETCHPTENADYVIQKALLE